MEWIGFLCFIIIIAYSSYPGKVDRLERRVKKLEKLEKGKERVSEMSKLIAGLVGKHCMIETEYGVLADAVKESECEVLDVDEEWIKVAYEEKKRGRVTKLIRIEDIESIEEIGV